jgi:hypothetical protein
MNAARSHDLGAPGLARVRSAREAARAFLAAVLLAHLSAATAAQSAGERVTEAAGAAATETTADAGTARGAPPVSRAARGTSGSFELSSETPIRAKATSDLTAPILVRASEIAPKRFRIEYMGLVSGTYDLAPYLEQTDGRTAAFDTPLRVEVFTQLPPNHGTDVFGLSAPSFGLSARYRELLIGAAVAWVLVPAIVIGVRIARRRPAPEPTPAPRVPTLAERLFEIVDGARTRELSTDERGRLELLLLRILREHVSAAGAPNAPGGAPITPAALAAATEALRDDPAHGPVVRAVERWLHARDDGESREALAALDRLRGVAMEVAR